MPTAIAVSIDPDAKWDAGAARPHKCQSCAFTRTCTTNAARTAGWRVYSGPSITGKALDVVLCPPCVAGDPAPFRAECLTCGESTDDDGLATVTQDDARAWKFDHECEPDVRVERVERTSHDDTDGRED